MSQLAELIKPIQKTRVSAEIVQQIKSFIINKNLKPGDKLPSERELSLMFSVGRPMVREALRTLHALNYVEILQGKGTFVKEFNYESYIDSLNEDIQMVLFSENVSIQEMWEARKLIEPAICALASQKASEKDLDHLQQIIRDRNNHVENEEEFPRLAAMFHRQIAECTGNKVILFIVNALLTLRKKTRFQVMKKKGYRVETFKCHQQIFKAIKNRESHLAHKLMLEHLEKAEEHYKSCRD